MLGVLHVDRAHDGVSLRDFLCRDSSMDVGWTKHRNSRAPFMDDEIVGAPVIERARSIIELVDDCFYRALQFLKRTEGAPAKCALEVANAVLDGTFVRRRPRANGIGQRSEVLAERRELSLIAAFVKMFAQDRGSKVVNADCSGIAPAAKMPFCIADRKVGTL